MGRCADGRGDLAAGLFHGGCSMPSRTRGSSGVVA
jgi:hypothetical protein